MHSAVSSAHPRLRYRPRQQVIAPAVGGNVQSVPRARFPGASIAPGVVLGLYLGPGLLLRPFTATGKDLGLIAIAPGVATLAT